MNRKHLSIYALVAAVGMLLLVAVAIRLGFRLDAESIYRGQAFLPLLVIAAIIDSINPCAFSVLLLTIGFLFSLGKNQARILKVGGVYILGVFVMYFLIGVGILQAMMLFNTPHFMSKAGAVIIIVLGAISILKKFFPEMPIRLGIPQAAHQKIAGFIEKGSMPASLFLGAFVGIVEFPCTGGPYLTILGLLNDASTKIKGLGYLVLYNIIFIAPLALLLFIASNKNLLLKAQEWKKINMNKMDLISGAAMIILGIIIFIF